MGGELSQEESIGACRMTQPVRDLIAKPNLPLPRTHTVAGETGVLASCSLTHVTTITTTEN